MRDLIGKRFRLDSASYQPDPPYVVVVAVETNHVLVELEGVENRWGGPERKWVDRSAFAQERWHAVEA